ncbi:MAG TPA: substrate-binding domain-containing protein [Methylomirabilota bacterium]|nr:substrate-binding domain-containing protein [Methylomirabilota bacterium]
MGLRRALVAAALLGALTFTPSAAVKINGSTTVNLPVAEAAEILRSEHKLAIHVDTQGGSSGGISSLGDGLVEIGMISKPLTDADRAKYPKVDFKTHQIGSDAVALIVSRDVWEAGVEALSRERMRGIYEGKIRNWKEVGGPDRRIAFFNKEPGRGTWEVFAQWLYGDPKKAPQVAFPEVGGNEETRNKVSSTRGAISQLSASWADGENVFALGLKDDTGKAILPTNDAVRSGAYRMSRPLYLLTNGEPTGEVKQIIDFMLSPRGAEIIRKHGYLPMVDLK